MLYFYFEHSLHKSTHNQRFCYSQITCSSSTMKPPFSIFSRDAADDVALYTSSPLKISRSSSFAAVLSRSRHHRRCEGPTMTWLHSGSTATEWIMGSVLVWCWSTTLIVVCESKSTLFRSVCVPLSLSNRRMSLAGLLLLLHLPQQWSDDGTKELCNFGILKWMRRRNNSSLVHNSFWSVSLGTMLPSPKNPYF